MLRKAMSWALGATLIALVAVPAATADGTETLGPPSVAIATGTNAVAFGVGMSLFPDADQSFNVTIPAGAVVKQVLLYWEGHWTDHAPHWSNTPQVDGDNEISIRKSSDAFDPSHLVTGTKIGGSTAFYQQFAGAVDGTEMHVAYRADITSRNLVGPGSNTLTVSNMSFASNSPTGFPFNQGNDGAGVIVIYEVAGSPSTIAVRDGLDLAFYAFVPPLDTTVPQTFTFPASTLARTATLSTFAGSVAHPASPGLRPNQLKLTFDVGADQIVDTPWQSNSGMEFDALNLAVTIPAGATTTTVQALSAGEGGVPASFAWVGATLSVPNPPLGALGDFVWHDLDADGIQDAGEPGIPGVTTRLYDCAGNLVATTTTNANGLYLFTSLAAGGYRVEFVQPAGFVFSPADQGANDAVDSDANTTTGMTGCYTLAEGETNLTVDAGLNVPPPPSGETATGFGYVYPKTSNWFMYTKYGTSKVNLVSGRNHTDVGDIFMSRTGSGSTAKTTIRVELHSGWSWAAVPEVLKIQPFLSAPTTYVEPGAFLYKFTAPNIAKDPTTTVSFAGQTVVVTMPGHSPKFYGIHADVLNN